MPIAAGETICDPACGTGGFLLAAHDYVVKHNPNLTKDQKKFLNEKTVKGVELVHSVVRLCAMNLLLHGIGSQNHEPMEPNDSLAADPGDRFDIVLTNPPFGKKSSTTIVGKLVAIIGPRRHPGMRVADDQRLAIGCGDRLRPGFYPDIPGRRKKRGQSPFARP
jgi:23S rRNA G2445 N2-methylase RlmL